MSKYPSGIEIPPAIKRIDSIPIRRSYEEIIKGVHPIKIEDMRQQAREYWNTATEGYRAGFGTEEEGIQSLVVLADWSGRMSRKQESR